MATVSLDSGLCSPMNLRFKRCHIFGAYGDCVLGLRAMNLSLLCAILLGFFDNCVLELGPMNLSLLCAILLGFFDNCVLELGAMQPHEPQFIVPYFWGFLSLDSGLCSPINLRCIRCLISVSSDSGLCSPMNLRCNRCHIFGAFCQLCPWT